MDGQMPPESDPLTEVISKMKEHQQVLEGLKSVPDMIEKLSQAVGIGKNDRTGKWSLGLSDDENVENDCHKMLDWGDEEELDTSQDRENPELEALLADIEKETTFGDEVLPQVAESFIKTVQRPLTKESREKLKIALQTPSNCKQFIPPKINPEIWRILPANARLIDVKNQQFQQAISGVLSALSMIASTVVNKKTEIPKEITNKVVKLAMEAGNILGDQIQSINVNRRQDVRKYLNHEYVGICNTQIQQSEWLFGNELTESLKSSKATSALIRQTSNRSSNRYQPYAPRPRSNAGSLNGSRPFRPQFQRGNGQYRPILPPRAFASQTRQFNQQMQRKY